MEVDRLEGGVTSTVETETETKDNSFSFSLPTAHPEQNRTEQQDGTKKTGMREGIAKPS